MVIKILNFKNLILLLILSSLFFIFFTFDILNSDTHITRVNIISIDGPIKLNTANYIERIILENNNNGNNIIVLILNTPGGSYEATRKIIELILASKVPVISYVYPSGGQAASAGTFIMAASHISAMSPFTSIGSATPVAIDGEDLPETLENKISEDASALIRELAKSRNRNIKLFESTIKESASFNSNEALESNMIEYVVNDLNSLINTINGEQINLGSTLFTINTDNFVLVTQDMSLTEKIIDFISRPNITFLFLTLGALLIFMEILIPGTIVSGVFGIMLLILAFLGLNNLPVNYFAVILLILSLVLIYIEFILAGFGIAGLLSIFSFLFGSILLFGNNRISFLPSNTESSIFLGFNVNSWIIFIITLTFISFILFLIFDIRKSQTKKQQYNFDILNLIGITKSELNPKGFVYIKDEVWSAESYNLKNIPINTKIRVKSMDKLTLKVQIEKDNDNI